MQDLLVFSKPAAPSRSTCDIRAMIDDILELLSSDILKAKIEVSRKYGDALGVCWADPGQIKQVLLNIIMNSIEAMRGRGGRLEVEVTVAAGQLEISIRDTGVGMAADKLTHIFDPFYTTKDGGTGLGLAITHSLIAQNNGSIRVESKEGQGSLFVITLPSKIS